MDLLRTRYPDWKNLKIHESSASGPVYHLFMRECNGYQASQFFEGGARGEVYQGFRCEDLGNQTFPDESFDLVITQDVLEHLPDPESAFREIARTLKPGGAHLFTVPWYRGTKTRARAKFHENGKVEHLLPPQYHGNPVDPCGSLVVTDWGDDMLQVIFDSSGMTTEVFDAVQLGKGIDGEFREVFLSLKPNEGRSSKP
ncbi:MAG TPA: methyltransferase domain-containing protein [Fibrobacteria bacterium]|nr:methyltransferase domain-containing protein [Fibrobacteria bacterium]